MFNVENIPTSSSTFVSKILPPGSHMVRLLNIELKPSPFGNNGYMLMMFVEGLVPPEGDFVGLEIDKNNPALGTYKGQVARLDFQRFAFVDEVIDTKNGPLQKYRDQEIASKLMGFAQQIGKHEYLKAQKVSGSTIEEFVANVARLLCTGDYGIWVTLNQREYTKQDGKTGTTLFFPRGENGKFPYTAMPPVGEQPVKLLAYDEKNNIPLKTASAAPANQQSAAGGFGAPAAQGGFGAPAATGFGTPAPQGFGGQPVQQAAPQTVPAGWGNNQPQVAVQPAAYQGNPAHMGGFPQAAPMGGYVQTPAPQAAPQVAQPMAQQPMQQPVQQVVQPVAQQPSWSNNQMSPQQGAYEQAATQPGYVQANDPNYVPF